MKNRKKRRYLRMARHKGNVIYQEYIKVNHDKRLFKPINNFVAELIAQTCLS